MTAEGPFISSRPRSKARKIHAARGGSTSIIHLVATSMADKATASKSVSTWSSRILSSRLINARWLQVDQARRTWNKEEYTEKAKRKDDEERERMKENEERKRKEESLWTS